MLNFEALRIALALAGTSGAAWQDWKTSFIDDRLTGAMIAAGVLLGLASGDVNLAIATVVGVAFIGGLGWLFYRTGQLGGGDVLLFAGLHALLPTAPSFTPPTLSLLALPPMFSVFVFASLLAVLGSAGHYARLLRGRTPKPDALPAAAVLALFAASAFFLASADALSPALAALLALVFLPGAFLAAFRRQITRDLLIQRVPVPKLLAEDVLALENLPPRLVQKHRLGRVATQAAMAKLRALHRRGVLRRVPVYVGLPRFGPYVLAGLLAFLLAGDAPSLFLRFA